MYSTHTFSKLDEYAREGIDGSTITYENNEGLLDMILSKTPPGLLAIVDEQSSFPKATDASLVEKLHQDLSKNPKYEKPRGNEVIFTINHYAGRVTYTAAGFLDKNRDTLPLDVICVMLDSDKDLVCTIFKDENPDGKDAKKDKKAKRLSMRSNITKVSCLLQLPSHDLIIE